MIYLIVTESFLFGVGGVIASGAGYVSIPTYVSASRSLCFMTYLIVTESSFFGICSIITF